ncbi:hypothetical protein [[Clostridium] scindens]|uniref:hypothetical protein n=1 Tax=Clostridium scindens (strain JCM 10418 / VPI 12708) TaxID=29347 RepID=UPI003AB1F1FB
MGLKGITIETPPQAEAHINAADDRAIWEAVIGMDGVVNVGQKLKATLISNNLLRIYDGALVVGGAVGRIPFGEYEDITINNGTQNQLRNDLVVAQIEANGAIENMKLHYIQGVPGDVAKDPDYTAGNVYEGETLRQYPLYRVKLNGLNVEAVEPLFEVLPNLGKVKEEVGELNRKLSEFYTQNGKKITFTPKYDCDALVSYEADGWGYDGGLWQLEVTATSITKPTKTAGKRAVFHGHNNTYSYAKGWSYFIGLKAGTSYTFECTNYSGSGGGDANPIMTIQTFAKS